ncbi:Virulence factor Mce family protein [uncultured Mycobacterium sp.]|uniref:Virulence factor Mce family protein n=1 Tax=uncultured Mycobacterium sp. TaxID=171292 RepID=A0A1Y5NVF5_9MYCO|nr:Virulence factor Mce family protein [uncultured Mycobacterium sp.]
MKSRRGLTVAIAVVLAVVIVGGIGWLLRATVFKPNTITAYFTSATAIYPGDEVRVAGVKVGTIESIEAQGTKAKLVLAVDRKVPIPANAEAVIVSQNLVGARYVQLTPPYEDKGPTMHDGAVIGLDRTAIPVEWDEIKTQLMRLATDLGPAAEGQTTPVGRFIDTAANALDGNGEKLRDTIAQLSAVSKTLANGSGNIVDTIKNLQTFVTALRDSNTQIVQFQDRLASLSSVVDGSRSDIDGALTNLSSAVVDVQRFIAGTRNQTAEQLQRLSSVTKNLADNKLVVENLLHVAPNAIGNAYNIYNPDSQSALGGFALANFSNPLQVVCSAIGAIQNATADETGKECAQYLGPALRLLNFNYLPFPFNSYLGKSTSPDKLIYSEPGLAPGGAGGVPPGYEVPPAVSAYTGYNGDVPGPAGWGGPPNTHQGAYAPNGLPADPSPALFPGAPIPPGVPVGPAAQPPSNLEGILLPAEGNPPS